MIKKKTSYIEKLYINAQYFWKYPKTSENIHQKISVRQKNGILWKSAAYMVTTQNNSIGFTRKFY